jgi:Tfp pilus assembly protein PilX
LFFVIKPNKEEYVKIHHTPKTTEQGMALCVTLILVVVLLMAMASYMMLLDSQKNLVTRSQTWNAALTVAEAGIEEGLAQANASLSIFAITNGDFSNNGWGGSGGVFGPVSRSLSGGTYTVVIQTNISPIVCSTGYVTVPIVGGTISRAVEVVTTPESIINVGVGAINNINFNGNGVAVDSYNSTLTNLSTNGQYDPTKTSTNGNVASMQGLVDLGNHTIDGSLFLGPGATYANDGTVTGNVNYDANIQYPDVALPASAANWPTEAPSTNSVYDFTTSGNYIINQNLPIVVESGVTVNVNVTSTTFSPSSIQIHGGTSNSGTAVFYLNGPTSISIAGNTAVDASNRPDNLWFYGLPTLTSITFSGNSTFVGVIYAPEASLTLNGGGNNNGLIGSAIVNTITMNGHYNFHYDESLGQNSPYRYVAGSWSEL